MGGDNPIKRVVNAGTSIANATVNPLRETARALGADGVVDIINQGQAANTKFGNETADVLTGEGKKRDAKYNELKTAEDATNAAADAKKQAGAAAAAETEVQRQRMAGNTTDGSSGFSGSRSHSSNTLLTGPNGLDDEEDDKNVTYSRRTLSAQ